METISLKALSMARLQGNQQGNFMETTGKIEGNFVETVTKPDTKSFPHYCRPGNCHCSAKLPGSNFPAGCIQCKCKHHQESI
jgi:hypothetical protein